MKVVYFAIFFAISVVCHAGGITDADLIDEYNSAFYANNYLLAEKWIDVLLVKEPGNLDYQREKAKMLILNGKTQEFLGAMVLLRSINTTKALECFFQVVNFSKLPLKATEALKATFVNDKFITSRWDSRPDSIQAQGADPSFSGVVVPDFRKAREEARKKTCIANMRLLTGALEMHNMDESQMISSIDSSTITILKAKNYLRTDITPPEPQCKYYSQGDMTLDGVVACPLHGLCPAPD